MGTQSNSVLLWICLSKIYEENFIYNLVFAPYFLFKLLGFACAFRSVVEHLASMLEALLAFCFGTAEGLHHLIKKNLDKEMCNEIEA